jgi:DNA replication and repair protein RecF
VILRSIRLQQFRNYQDVQLNFPGQVIVLVGNNAQGKTNLLEAIYSLSLTKSHRTHVDAQLIGWNQPWAKVTAELDKKYGHCELEIIWMPKGKKTKINGLEQKKLSDFVGMCNVVLFAPEDLELVKGAPAARRRFLDMEIGQVQPAYLHMLSRYQKVLGQRNQLLKQASNSGMMREASFVSMIEVWNEQLIELGLQLSQRRRKFIDQLQEWAITIHHGITDGSEQLKLTYVSGTPGDDAEAWRQKLNANLEREVRQGTTLSGPHRDDLQFAINGNDVQTYGSQGQQRTTALSLKLAEMELIHAEIGEYPLVLLDDVLSELDPYRQTQLLDTVQQRAQVFITTTSLDGINRSKMNELQCFEVQNGQLIREDRK